MRHMLVVALLLGISDSHQMAGRSRSVIFADDTALVLFGADWCAPCMALKAEIQASGLSTTWPVDIGRCQVVVPVEHIDLTSAGTGGHPLKATEMLPEQVIRRGNERIAYENYSDVASITYFLETQLQPLLGKQLQSCGLQP